MSEDLVPVPAKGAARPSRQHHEGNQPPTGTTARDAFRAASGELVSLSHIHTYIHTYTHARAHTHALDI